MPTPTRRLAALVDLGMRETEAKAYLALLEHPGLGAADLGEIANVPRSHLYKVLQDLHAYGLVEIVLRKDARIYRARPFAVYLEKRIVDLRERLAQAEAELPRLGVELKPPAMEDPPPGAGDFRVMLGRRSVNREIELLLAAAKSEVIIACSDGPGGRLARQLAAAWAAWDERSVAPRVTLILPLGMGMEEELSSTLRGRDIEVRKFAMRRPMLSFVCDQARMVLVHPFPDSAETGSGRDFAIYSDDPAFVQGHAALLIASSAGRARPGD